VELLAMDLVNLVDLADLLANGFIGCIEKWIYW